MKTGLLLIFIVLFIGAVSVFTVNYFFKESTQNIITSGSDNQLYLYETEVASAEECTSYEKYNAEKQVCFYECNEDNCDQLRQSVESELESWADSSESTPLQADEKSIGDAFRLASYQVLKTEQLKQLSGQDDPVYQQIWNSIKVLSPDKLSNQYVDTFTIFSEANDNTIAFVDDPDQDGLWRIGVNIAIYQDQSERDKNLTIIHELAHIISLNSSEVVANYNTCANYETAEGCSNQSSLLNNFVKKFWSPEEIAQSATEQNDLYSRKPDSYISEYASTNPEEDLAESFAYFVVDQKSSGQSIKDQKQNFFYDFNNSASYREEIRNGLKSNIIRSRQK